MGVSAAGKTTVATRLAARLEYELGDADDFHPPENVVKKMARGEPLTDADREPWLRALAAWIAAQHAAQRSTVLACSALKRRYRDTLRTGAPQVFFIHLAASREALRARIDRRKGHFMPPELLDSQLATLEPLRADEPGVTLDGTAPPDILVEQALGHFGA
jgi:gluconokinase